MREALNSLERSSALSKDEENDNNSINNSNNGKNGEGNVGGKRREEISTSWDDHPHNLLRLSVETAAIQCTLGEISYAPDKRWGRHIPSFPSI